MQGLLYVLIAALMLGYSWKLIFLAAKILKNHHEEELNIKAMEE